MHDELKPGEVMNARRPEVAKIEGQVMGFAGAGLLGLAAIFLWRELQVRAEVLLVVGTIAAAVGAEVLRRVKLPVLGPVVLLGATAAGAAWYGATREPMLLVGLAVAFGASLVMALLDRRTPPAVGESHRDRLHRMLSWHGLALSGLVTSLAVYFQVFDASDLSLQDFVARRAILSLTWLLAGVALVLFGRARRATEVRDAGFVVLAAAVTKLLLYDTSHLDGFLRIGALAAGGAVLLGSAVLVRRLNAAVRS